MRKPRLFNATISALALVCLGASSLSAAPPDQLGKVNFPTLCSSEVQPTIEKGVALLHSFQYQESEQTFTEAAKREPKCAMAHWGKAMALYHQLWDFPQEDTLKEGRKDIEQAEKIHPADPREEGFIAAAAAFFQKKKMSHADRIKAYSAAMGKFYLVNPGDSEIGSFYALSLVSLASVDDANDLADRTSAIAILNPLLESYPDHPGVAHYLIHAADRPELASHGLEAARRYAKIAPDSSHAIHMPSHIFVRLGMWQESINSNLAANAAGAHAAEMHLAESHYQTHAMDFLSYSYLQSGQEAKAREVIEHTNHVVGATDEMKARDHDYLSARTALELHRWKEAAELAIPADRKNWDDTTFWARAIGAARSGDVPAAEAAIKQLAEIVADDQKRAYKQGYKMTGESSDLAEAKAWLAFAKGNSDEALAKLRDAADREDKNGGESVGIPAREMLADMLLESKRPVDALTEYKASLQLSPNRFDSLYGAMRAAASVNTPEMHAAAESYLLEFMKCCGFGGDRPEIKEAGKFVSLHPQDAPVPSVEQ